MIAAEHVDAAMALGLRVSDVRSVEAVALSSSGAATGSVVELTFRPSAGPPVRVIKKIAAGRVRPAGLEVSHWAHPGREASAYRSGVLPAGPDLRSPEPLAVIGDTVYLEHVGENRPSLERAVSSLASWHRRAALPSVDWLADDQLGQRLAATRGTDLDGAGPEQVRSIWARRFPLVAALDRLPRCIAHGDFHFDNLRTVDEHVVALDWATLGSSAVGFDLAHLALSTLRADLLEPYLDGIDGVHSRSGVELGYRTAVALIGASRARWMVSRGIDPPEGYLDFVVDHAP